MALNTNWFDWLTFGFYLAGVFGFGIYMSRHERSSADFFLAGRRLPWYAISLSLFSTNISSGSLIGLAGDGYRYGLAVGTLEWGAIFGLLLLTFVFLPYYQRRAVYTMPEFMEYRYNLAVRLLFSGAVLIFEMVVNTPFMLYAGALAVEVMFHIPLIWGMLGMSLFTVCYTAWGGLGAVVWTDVVQAGLMVLGATVLVLLGLHEIGGFRALMAHASEKMHVCLPANSPAYPFPATMIGGYFLVTVYYWCQNQTLVQRVLGARSEWDARMGTVGACYIKLFTPFIYVLPGVIAFVMFPHLRDPDKALPMLIDKVIPFGLGGLMITAVVAALMSSLSSSLNSWATLFTCDFYHRLLDKRATERKLVLVGRLASVFVVVVAILIAPHLRNNASILQFLLNGLAYLATPVIVLFTVGIFWRRASSAGALFTIVLSPAICYASQHMRSLFGWGPTQISIVYWMPIAVAVAAACMIIVSVFGRPKAESCLKDLIWSRKDTLTFGSHLRHRFDLVGSENGPHLSRPLHPWEDYRLMGALALILMGAIIWFFR